MKAILDRLLVEILDNDEETLSSGLIVKGEKKPSARGKVISVGPDVKHVKKGDTVLFGQDKLQNKVLENTVVLNETYIFAVE